MTRAGDPSITSAVKKFGTASLSVMNGDLSSLLDFHWGAVSTLGGNDADPANDFTIEFFLNPGELSGHSVLVAMSPFGFLQQRPGGQVDLNPVSGGIATCYPALAVGSWSHIAIVKHGANWLLFFDGVCQPWSINTIGANAYFGSDEFIRLGNGTEFVQPFIGYIDEFRVARRAVYTSDFTPPTEPFTS